MPEGDTLHRAARRLQVLVGEQVEVEAPHPRAQAIGRRRAARRTTARVGRGIRQEPRAALRGRRRSPFASADERPLDGASARSRGAQGGRGSCFVVRRRRRSFGTARCSSCTPVRSQASAPTSSRYRLTSRRCSRGSIAPTSDRRFGDTLQDQRLDRRHREHVDGRDAVACAPLAVGAR